MTPPTGLQLDLLTAVLRLQQISELPPGDPFASYLLRERVIGCDLPRLRGHLTADTLAWWAAANAP